MTDKPTLLEDMSEPEQAEILLAWFHKRPLQYWDTVHYRWVDRKSVKSPEPEGIYRLKPEPRRGVAYVNVYSGPEKLWLGGAHEARAGADKATFDNSKRIARVKVQWQEGSLMTDIVKQVKEALDGTTEGPWFVHNFTDPVIADKPTAQDVTISCTHPDHITVAVMMGGDAGYLDLDRARHDARLISLAPTMARALIAQDDEIERLNGRVTELENVANSSESQLHHYAYEAMKAQEEIERLREALQECADSLEAYVEHEYVSTKDHPAMKWRYERDMEDVYRARALLKGEIKYD